MDDLFSQEPRERRAKGPPLVLLPSVFWWALLGAVATALLVIFWAFFGSIPLQAQVEGIIFNPSKLFTIHAPQNGTVGQVYAKWGDSVRIGETLIELMDPPEKIASEIEGQVLEVLVEPGQSVASGQTVVWIQKPLETGELYQIAGVVPSPADQEILVGMEVEIALDTVNSGLYGQLVGRIDRIVPYWTAEARTLFPFSKHFTRGAKHFQNLLVISLIENKKTFTGYLWTTIGGAPINFFPGTRVDFLFLIADKEPIYQLFN